MGGGRSAPAAPQVITRSNPYDDSWIHDRFAQGQTSFDELSDFMNQRKTALAAGQMYDVGGGMNVKQADFGKYIQGQLDTAKAGYDKQFAEMKAVQDAAAKKQQNIYDARLGDITAAAGANRQSLQTQQEALAKLGERNRARTYSGTGSGFNRSGLRIQGLNV